MTKDKIIYKYWDGSTYVITKPPFIQHLHREDGPALLKFNNNELIREIWYFKNKIHRKGGPAELYYYKPDHIFMEIWREDGLYHREDGPAVTEKWITGSLKMVSWYKRGKLHHEHIPAKEEWAITKRRVARVWAIDGEQMDKSKWDRMMTAKKFELI